MLLYALSSTVLTAAVQETGTPAEAPASGSRETANVLRTFTLEKPPALIASEREIKQPQDVPLNLPRAHDALRTTFGLGYVQGADWGSEILATGGVKGIQVQSNTLLTRGATGYRFDNGSLSFFDPDRRWHLEGGDIFSNLRGASRGGRVSWQGAGHRRPAISLYGPRPGSEQRPTVVSYRDQLTVGGQTLVDAEVATDKSYLLRNRLAGSRVEFETSYRSHRKPVSSRDISLFAGLVLWRGVAVTGGVFRSLEASEPSEWRTASIRVPFSRLFSLTLERAYSASAYASNTTTAAAASVSAGGLTFFHRYQTGESDQLQGASNSVQRQQNQSVANYTPRSWVNLTLQLASQRAETGVLQHWEELQTTLTPTRSTSLRLAMPVSDLHTEQKFRGLVRQEFRGRFALQAEYGRLSAFQDVPRALDRTRLKVMLYKTWSIATPARGATVRGRVLDEAGRAVAGARVKLGPYATASDSNGAYAFDNVPRGEYDLSLDPQFLPADYAWDGRQLGLTLSWSSRIDADLLVAPLNAIHGRVYHDRNGNGRFDAGEGVAGTAVYLKERVTATDQDGAYSFYNLWPGTYVVALNGANLPGGYTVVGPAELTVEIADGRPVTGADFTVATRTKPILWTEPRK